VLAAEVAKWEALGDVDVGKRIKNLKKKVRQIEELESKVKAGEDLNEGEKGGMVGGGDRERGCGRAYAVGMGRLH
jgi:hypothetical protein